MTVDVQIQCIRKTNRTSPHERIHGVGGANANGTRWFLPLDEAIKRALDKTYRFWTAGGGKSVWVIVAYHEGHPYLKTEADGVQPNNLLALPECP